MTDELPRTVRELRVQAATAGARAGHVVEHVITTSTTPMSRPDVELSVMATFAMVYGFALAEALRRVDERDPALVEELLHVVNSIAMDGDDGQCVDVWPDVKQKLATGGVGTPQWEAVAALAAPTIASMTAARRITRQGPRHD